MAGRAWAVALVVILTRAAAGASPPPAGAAASDDLARALLMATPEGDVAVFDGPHHLVLAARVNASAARLIALLADPAAYQRAVPAFVRADTVRSEDSGTSAPPARLLAWELEIPLWNLKGRLWLRPRVDGADFELVDGDLAPGRFALRVQATAAGTTLTLEGAADVRNATWITRRLARRDPLSEPAMTATAAYVLLRAITLEAERTGPAPLSSRWPRGPSSAPAAEGLEGVPLATALARSPGASREGRAVALVTSRPDGRLRQVALAVWPRLSPPRLLAHLGEVDRWRALPGWSAITTRAAPGPVWDVDANLPFVDFDALWKVAWGPTSFRAAADGGDWQGAVMGWDLPTRVGEAAIFTLHPRLENTGYIPRHLIAAEPLLEHGLSLGLAYVDAVALTRALEHQDAHQDARPDAR